MLKKFKRWLWRQRVAKHEARFGNQYDYFGKRVTMWAGAHPNLKYKLLRGDYENPEAELIEQLIAQDTNILELGGSLGIVSQYTRLKIGPDAKQIIVEADPTLSKVCQEVMAPHKNTKVISAALAYDTDEVSFALGNGNAHVGKVSSGSTSTQSTIKVPATTIKKLSKNFSKANKNALICDIEGAELELIKKEGELVAKLFDMVLFEFHPAAFSQHNSSAEDFFSACENVGLMVIVKNDNVAAFKSQIREQA